MKTISAEDFDKNSMMAKIWMTMSTGPRQLVPGWSWCMSMLIFLKKFCGEWMRKRRALAGHVNP